MADDKFSIECNYTDVDTPVNAALQPSSKRDINQSEKISSGVLITLIICTFIFEIGLMAQGVMYLVKYGTIKPEDKMHMLSGIILWILIFMIMIYLFDQLINE